MGVERGANIVVEVKAAAHQHQDDAGKKEDGPGNGRNRKPQRISAEQRF
jgi:hypothetical protein